MPNPNHGPNSIITIDQYLPWIDVYYPLHTSSNGGRTHAGREIDDEDDEDDEASVRIVPATEAHRRRASPFFP